MSTLQFKSIRVFVRFGHCGIWIRMANETADVEADRQMFRDIGVTRRSTCSQWSPTGQPLTMGLGSVFYWKMLNLICFPQRRIQKREQNIQKVLLELSDLCFMKHLFVFLSLHETNSSHKIAMSYSPTCITNFDIMNFFFPVKSERF